MGGTNRGNLVLWQPLKENQEKPDHNMKMGRLLRLEEEGITSMVETETLIIVGIKTGVITLLNFELQKIKWTQKFDIPKIISISLNIEDEYFQPLEDDYTITDFIFGCEGEQIHYYNCQTETISTILDGPGT